MKIKILIPLLAGVAMLWACKGKGRASADYEVVNNSSADSAKLDSIVSTHPKIVKTAELRFKVKNIQQTSERINILTTSFKGMTMHHRMSSEAERTTEIHLKNDSILQVTSFRTTAEMTIKVPSEKLEDFMNQVAKLGIYVNIRTSDLSDRSLDYLSAQLKLRNRAEIISRQKKGKIIIKDPAKVLTLTDDMIDQQIDNKTIDDAVRYSVVNLSLYQSNSLAKEMIANDDPSTFNIDFFSRLGMALSNGWEIFKDGLLALANLWVLVLIGFGTWGLLRYYRTKKLVAVLKT